MTVSSVKQPSQASQIQDLVEQAKRRAVIDASKGTGVSTDIASQFRSGARAADDIQGLSLGDIARQDPVLAKALDSLHTALAAATGTTGLKASDLDPAAATGLERAIGTLAGDLGLDSGTLRNLMFGTYGAAQAGFSGSSGSGSSGSSSSGNNFSIAGGSSGSGAISDASAQHVGAGVFSAGSPESAANKAAALAGIAGASAAQKSFVIAIGMQETTSFNPNDRDKSKDGNTDGSRNFSCFNMNEAMLKDLGLSQAQMVALNDPSNEGQAAQVLLAAEKKYGEDGFLCWHRGGASCYNSYVASGYKSMTEGSVGKPTWYQQYYDAVYTAQNAIAANPDLLTNTTRVINPSTQSG